MIGIVDVVGWAYFGKDLVSFRKLQWVWLGLGKEVGVATAKRS